MGCVKFAEKFAQKNLEIIVVVDVREELCIFVVIHLPVDSVDGRIVELFGDLKPHVVEHISPLAGGVKFHLACNHYRLCHSAHKVDLHRRTVAQGKKTLLVCAELGC